MTEFSITITGSRTIHRSPELDARLQRFVEPFAVGRAHFYLGGAAGIDTAAGEWLFEHTEVDLTVVVPCAMRDQPEIARSAVTRWRHTGRVRQVVELGAPVLNTAAFHARNRWMVDRSDLVVGFPAADGRRGGTWYTLDYAAQQSIPWLVVPN